MYFLNENYEAKLTWKYKIALQDPAVFDRISDIRGIKFPNELKSFIIKNNGATPSSYRFKVGKTERNFGAVLSFNQVKKGTDSVYSALSVIEDKNLIPFGIDPFGNYICYSVKNGKVVFWDHETGKVSSTNLLFKKFIDSLY